VNQTATTLALVFLATIFWACSGGPLTTREKGAGIGALGGAAAGGIAVLLAPLQAIPEWGRLLGAR
jgi:hypothetical protein